MDEIVSPELPLIGSLPASSAPRDQAPQTALPVPLTPLIGRACEVAAARDALRSPEVRLVSPPG